MIAALIAKVMFGVNAMILILACLAVGIADLIITLNRNKSEKKEVLKEGANI